MSLPFKKAAQLRDEPALVRAAIIANELAEKQGTGSQLKNYRKLGTKAIVAAAAAGAAVFTCGVACGVAIDRVVLKLREKKQ